MQIFCKIPWVKAESLHFSHMYLFYKITKITNIGPLRYLKKYRSLHSRRGKAEDVFFVSIAQSGIFSPDKRTRVC